MRCRCRTQRVGRVCGVSPEGRVCPLLSGTVVFSSGGQIGKKLRLIPLFCQASREPVRTFLPGSQKQACLNRENVTSPPFPYLPLPAFRWHGAGFGGRIRRSLLAAAVIDQEKGYFQNMAAKRTPFDSTYKSLFKDPEMVAACCVS